MNRIRRLVNAKGQRKLLVPFFTAGYPNLSKSLQYVRAAANAGADIVEIGIPFSDPVADGPAIQYSSQVALKKGTTLAAILGSVRKLRKSIDIPLVLMGYYNPLLSFDLKRFFNQAAKAGVDGLIVPDLPVEEATQFSALAKHYKISLIFLVAPTSDDNRIKMIDRLSDDLVYAVTVTGVTGSRSGVAKETEAYLKDLRSKLSKPFVAGFGVSSAQSARRLANSADGVVIGSALIDIIRKSSDQKSAVRKVTHLLTSIRRALDSLS